jgi:hypothetical protein
MPILRENFDIFVAEVATKRLFLVKNCPNFLSGWGLRPQTPFASDKHNKNSSSDHKNSLEQAGILCYSLNFCASLLDFRFGNFWNYLEPS